MKFGKELASQMVQEWKEAYMDYNSLKSLLKDIIHLKQRNKASKMEAPKKSFRRRVSLYRAFSGLTGRQKVSPRKEDEAILVSSVDEEGTEGGEEKYCTTFLNAEDESRDSELVFFRKLDHEFNKVNEFYRKKVEQVIAEAEDLSKQMDALIALRIKVEKPVEIVPGPLMHPINATNSGFLPMEVIQEVEMSCEPISEYGNSEHSNRRDKAAGCSGFRPAPLEVLDHVKINIEPITPVSTVKTIISSSKADLLYSKEELRKVEELLSRAFVQFYQKLRLLKSYSFLNQLAFAKILKKYDKITLRNASKTYLRMVENSYLGSSDEITKLLERVEASFIKHFANGNHRKGMSVLRPTARREKHRITFSLGFFSGCAIALLVALVVAIHMRNLINSPGGPKYMKNIFPLYSLFGFIVLHMILYAANIYFWKRYRINYPFIFGFKQGTELGYREVLLVSSALAVLTLGAVLSNLDMEIDQRTSSFKAITELVPLGLLTLVLIIIFCPFNIIYHSSRFFLIHCAFHCICAPFYKVSLSDFFLADQLTSQVQAFRNLEFYVCYYGWGNFKTRTNTCSGSEIYKSFYFVVAMIPFWMRFLQCLRRFFEEKDYMHVANALRYLSTIVAVAMRTIYELNKGMNNWKILAAVTSGVATIFSIYWDIVIDWGLLRRNSKNPWLRDKLIIPNRSVYFIAMVLNVVLRFAWMQSVGLLGFTTVPFLHGTAVVTILACFEIIRRGIWNFFRLENEHLNNVGKYRAFKSVPLPFYYDDQEDKHV